MVSFTDVFIILLAKRLASTFTYLAKIGLSLLPSIDNKKTEIISC